MGQSKNYEEPGHAFVMLMDWFVFYLLHPGRASIPDPSRKWREDAGSPTKDLV